MTSYNVRAWAGESEGGLIREYFFDPAAWVRREKLSDSIARAKLMFSFRMPRFDDRNNIILPTYLRPYLPILMRSGEEVAMKRYLA